MAITAESIKTKLKLNLSSPTNYLSDTGVKSAYETLVIQLEKCQPGNVNIILTEIVELVKRKWKTVLTNKKWFNERKKDIETYLQKCTSSQLGTVETPPPSQHANGKKTRGKLTQNKGQVSPDSKVQYGQGQYESSIEKLKYIYKMMADISEVHIGPNTTAADEINHLASCIQTKLIDIDSNCIDVSKQIRDMQSAFKVQKEDVSGGIKCIPLWKGTLDDILQMQKHASDPKGNKQTGGETKLQEAIHGETNQQKTDSKGTAQAEHNATNPKQTRGQDKNVDDNLSHEKTEMLTQQVKNVHKLEEENKDLTSKLKEETDKNTKLEKDVDYFKKLYNKLLEKENRQKEVQNENEKAKSNSSMGQKKQVADDRNVTNRRTPTQKPDEYIEQLTTKLSDERNKVAHLREDIKKEREEIMKLEDNVVYWKNRVSKIAGSKLTDNNPGITDLSDPNRPTRLAEIFGEIYDNVWTDTLEGLNKPKRIKTEKDAVLHMASILEVCYIYCENKFEETLEQMEEVLLLKSQKKSGDVKLDKEEEKQLKDMLKTIGVRTSKCLDQDDLIKCVTDRNLQKAMQKQAVTKDFTKDMQKHQAVTKDFTKQCLEICWLMVIQDPPVVLYWGDSTVGSLIDADRFKAFTRSGDSLEYIVWPAVLLHNNGPLLNKGIVQPQQSSQNTRL